MDALPEHRLTKANLAAAVRNYASVENAHIVDFNVSEGCGKDENFSCSLKAVNVEARVGGGDEIEEFNFMAKCLWMKPSKVKKMRDVRLLCVLL